MTRSAFTAMKFRERELTIRYKWWRTNGKPIGKALGVELDEVALEQIFRDLRRVKQLSGKLYVDHPGIVGTWELK